MSTVRLEFTDGYIEAVHNVEKIRVTPDTLWLFGSQAKKHLLREIDLSHIRSFALEGKHG